MASKRSNEGGFVHRRLRILVPLRHRDFRLLWTGMTVSLLGDGITTIALAWQAYEISNVPTAFSMVAFSMTVPHVVLLLIGGAVSDRFDRRRVMIAADLVRMVAVLLLGLLSVTGEIQIWHMMVIAACYGAGTAFFGPAFDAIVPDLVPPAELPQANALDQFVRPAAFRMLGPALGGWLIAATGSPGNAFLVDGLTFAISVACLLAMRSRAHHSGDLGTAGSMFGEIREGFRYVRTQVWLWGTFLAATLAYLVFWGPAEVLLPFIVKNEMGGSAGQLGFILAMGGVGAMFTAVVMGNREMPRRHMTFMYLTWTASTLAIAGYGFARLPWQAMVFTFTFNALESAGLIVWITTKQRLVPGRLLGRVSSFDWFISTGLVPFSYALTGPVAEVLGARMTLVAAGILGGVVTISFLFIPGMRAIERTATAPDTHSALAARSDARPDAMELDAAASLDAGPAEVSEQSPVGHARHPSSLRAVMDEPVVGRYLETLEQMRAAVARWRASRIELHVEVEQLELREEALAEELGRVRARLDVLRALGSNIRHDQGEVPSAASLLAASRQAPGSPDDLEAASEGASG